MKPDRTKQDKLFKALKKAGKRDFRVGQIIEIVRHTRNDDLFYIENDALADLINKYLG